MSVVKVFYKLSAPNHFKVVRFNVFNMNLSLFEEVKQALEEKRKDRQSRRGKSLKPTSAVAQKELPKAPEKPSFCSSAETTQYYFDGCMVQVMIF